MKHLVPSLHEPVREVRRQRVVPKRRRSFRVFVVSGELVPGKAQQRGREGGGGSRSASSSLHLFFPKLFFLCEEKKSSVFTLFNTLRERRRRRTVSAQRRSEREREREREKRAENKTITCPPRRPLLCRRCDCTETFSERRNGFRRRTRTVCTKKSNWSFGKIVHSRTRETSRRSERSPSTGWTG